MSKILSMFGLKKTDDDNIPEVILNKDDPAPYYDKDLKVWMIPGQEEEIKKMVSDQKKPPPIGKSKKTENTNNSISNANPSTNLNSNSENIDNSLVNPRKQIPLQKKVVKVPNNIYAENFPGNPIKASTKTYEKEQEEINPQFSINNNDETSKYQTNVTNINKFTPGRSNQLDDENNVKENDSVKVNGENNKINEKISIEDKNGCLKDNLILNQNQQIDGNQENTIYVISKLN